MMLDTRVTLVSYLCLCTLFWGKTMLRADPSETGERAHIVLIWRNGPSGVPGAAAAEASFRVPALAKAHTKGTESILQLACLTYSAFPLFSPKSSHVSLLFGERSVLYLAARARGWAGNILSVLWPSRWASARLVPIFHLHLSRNQSSHCSQGQAQFSSESRGSTPVQGHLLSSESAQNQQKLGKKHSKKQASQHHQSELLSGGSLQLPTHHHLCMLKMPKKDEQSSARGSKAESHSISHSKKQKWLRLQCTVPHHSLRNAVTETC